MNGPSKLRELLETPGLVVAPGVYDCVGAKLVESEGFKAVYMTGNGSVASRMGRPDIGLATMSQMVEWARSIVMSVDIPLICDSDNGYGGLSNVKEAVREFENAGVAAIHIEDQVFPKRCGAMEGVQLVSPEDAAARISVASSARKDMLIIARTDSLSAGHDTKDAIHRLNLFADAGADILFPEMIGSREQLDEIVRNVKLPLMFDIIEFGKYAPNLDELEDAGVKIVFNCLSLMFLNAACMKNALSRFKVDKDWKTQKEGMMHLHDYENLMGLQEEIQLQSRFAKS